MIALLCTMEPSRIQWLPQLVEHYRGLGGERFLLTIQLEPAAEAAAKDRDYALDAVAIALWRGAREVVMCGYSLRGGAGIVDSAPIRSHVVSDRRFLEICLKQGRQVSTTSEELQREVGLPPAP